MKKVFLTIICVIFLCLFSSCALSEKTVERIAKERYGGWGATQEEVAKNRMEKLLESMEKGDTEYIKGMFSKHAIDNVKSLEHDIESLVEFYQGKFVSYQDRISPNSEASFDYGKEQEIFYSYYEVKTTKQEYRIAMWDYVVDSENPENVGIWSLFISKKEDDIQRFNEYLDGEFNTPGIHFNLQQ